MMNAKVLVIVHTRVNLIDWKKCLNLKMRDSF